MYFLLFEPLVFTHCLCCEHYLTYSFTFFKVWNVMLLSYSAASAPVYENSLIEYGICNFTLLLNLLLILFVNIQHWYHEKLLLMVRLMVLEATSFLSSVVLLSRSPKLAQSSCHYQTLSCYLCQCMSHMLALGMLIADSFLSGLNALYYITFFSWYLLISFFMVYVASVLYGLMYFLCYSLHACNNL